MSNGLVPNLFRKYVNPKDTKIEILFAFLLKLKFKYFNLQNIQQILPIHCQFCVQLKNTCFGNVGLLWSFTIFEENMIPYFWCHIFGINVVFILTSAAPEWITLKTALKIKLNFNINIYKSTSVKKELRESINWFFHSFF